MERAPRDPAGATPAERDPAALLRGMDPVLQAGEWVFCSLDAERARPLQAEALGSFREAEGVTLILPRERAEAVGVAGARDSGSFRCITLTVHSSLAAVGFLAAVSDRLARAGVPLNAVAGFYHDHLFVPADRAHEALALLRELQREADGSRATPDDH